MNVTLIQQTPNPIEMIAQTASICYDSNPKNPEALVKRLYENGHHSPFEHVFFTWKVEGISRACSHQLVRHRLASFTQRSQRYCSEDGFKQVIPASVWENPDAVTKYLETITSIKESYKYLAEDCDIPNEDARYLLPNACHTTLYISCNLRELIHMCNERLCSHAQWEIRQLVHEMALSVDPGLRWMLVPKCKAPYLRCVHPCKEDTE